MNNWFNFQKSHCGFILVALTPLLFFSYQSDEDDSSSLSDIDKDDDDGGIKPTKMEAKKKKRSRKAQWSQTLLNDLVDIIISSDYYKKKLIFTNTKNQRNGDIYAKVLAELKERAAARKEEVTYNIAQIRTKFKKIISECKGEALKIKTSSRVKNFVEEKDYGKWFNDLFAIVKTRDACRPELAVEPSCSKTSSMFPNDNEESTSFSAEKKEKLVIKKPERKKKK